jgi:hypothetical protein
MEETDVELIKQLTSKIEGWLSEQEGELLFSLAKQVPKNRVIVES